MWRPHHTRTGHYTHSLHFDEQRASTGLPRVRLFRPFEDLVGPLGHKIDDGAISFAFRVEPRHCNTQSTLDSFAFRVEPRHCNTRHSTVVCS